MAPTCSSGGCATALFARTLPVPDFGRDHDDTIRLICREYGQSGAKPAGVDLPYVRSARLSAVVGWNRSRPRNFAAVVRILAATGDGPDWAAAAAGRPGSGLIEQTARPTATRIRPAAAQATRVHSGRRRPPSRRSHPRAPGCPRPGRQQCPTVPHGWGSSSCYGEGRDRNPTRKMTSTPSAMPGRPRRHRARNRRADRERDQASAIAPAR
jgi:hypothetical protein